MRRLFFVLLAGVVSCALIDDYDFENYRPAKEDAGVDAKVEAGGPGPRIDGSVVPVDATPPDGTTPVPCVGTGATVSEGHCYFLLDEGSFESAKKGCSDAGAHLMTIRSEAENEIARKIATKDAWIGLRAPTSSSDAAAYSWINGEPVTFTSWQSGQPDGSEDGCVVFNTNADAWSDRTCSAATNIAICERDP